MNILLRFLTRNLGWKIGSLLAALVLWFAFSGSGEMTMSLSAPVQYRSLSRQLEISSGLADTVHIQLRGSSTRLSRLTPGSVPIVIDLSEATRPGYRTVTLSETHIDLPTGVSVDRFVPSQIRLHLENRASREAPVSPRWSNLPDQFRVSAVEVHPAYLNILGPESHVGRIQALDTDTIDLRSAKPGVHEFKVEAYTGDGQVYFSGVSQVTVRLTLVPNTNSRSK